MKVHFIIFVVLAWACTSKDVKRQQLFLKGNIALEESDYQNALYYYGQALEMNDTFAAAFNNSGIAYEKLKNYDKALQNYEQAIAANPDFQEAYFNRANLWSLLGNYSNALTDLETIGEKYQRSPAFYFAKGLAYNGLKQDELAIEAFEKSIALDTLNAESYINLATIHFQRRNDEKAQLHIAKALKLESGNADALNLNALLLARQGRFEKALENINRALGQSSNPYFYNNRGYFYLMLGKIDKGLEDISYSMVIDDRNPWVYRNKGIYDFLTEDYTNAEKMLVKCVELDSLIELSHYYLGRVYMELADTNRACQHFTRSAEMGEEEGMGNYSIYCRGY